MKLSHIATICEIARQRFNMSEAAAALNRSQPALSRQLAELERELGVRVFDRTRNRISGLTAEGAQIVEAGRRIARELDTLRTTISGEGAAPEVRIATTHAHARYTLPGVLKRFKALHPQVVLNLRQGGDPRQCAQLVADAEADIGITTDVEAPPRGAVTVPVFKLSRCLFAPRGHPVTRQKLTLENIARYPLIAYTRPPGGWLFGPAFSEAGLEPRIVLNAIDADVSKTYVHAGLGIAILASIAYDPVADRKLVALNVDHLYRPGVLVAVLRQGARLTRHAESLLTLLAPHVAPDVFRSWAEGRATDRKALFEAAPTARFV